MTSPVRDGLRLAVPSVSLASGICVLAFSWTAAYGGDPGTDAPGDAGHRIQRGQSPGFQGFGLKFHLGYGYGGRALGAGDGGYPYYSGPGYPHEPPPLRRLGRIAPFAYDGGPDYPCRAGSHFFEPTGPLVVDPPLVTSGLDPRHYPYSSDYGPFSGAILYPESLFAPYASPVETPGRPSGSNPSRRPIPGFDDEATVAPDGRRGLKVTSVSEGSTAEKAGLRAGDVIHSVNGYPTTERGNLTWIIANATPDHLLKLDVQAATDGKRRTVQFLLR
jgi:hypothetical protein